MPTYIANNLDGQVRAKVSASTLRDAATALGTTEYHLRLCGYQRHPQHRVPCADGVWYQSLKSTEAPWSRDRASARDWKP